MIVMKFGGTSIGTPERIINVYNIVKNNIGNKPVVVVSAVGGVTDLLIAAGENALKGKVDISEIEKKHNKIIDEFGFPKAIVQKETEELKNLLRGISMIKEISPKTSDYLTSFGERISCQLVSRYLNDKGIKSTHHFAYDLGMITDDNHEDAHPVDNVYDNIKSSMSGYKDVPVITGFIGKNKAGDITTLGRGGSDFTAAIIGAAIGADEIQIWTDVDGIMTTDPRIVKEAKNIPVISFDEASELSYFGAKVLHPKTITPAMEKNIPVVVKNTHNINHPGTRILKKAEKGDSTVKAISVKKGVSLVNIYSLRMLDAYGFLARIFNIFNKYNVVVDMVSTSEVSVSVTVNEKADLKEVERELSEFSKVKIGKSKAIICVVGEGLKKDEKMTGQVFSTLSNLGVNAEMISQGASDINLSFVVSEVQSSDVVKALHSSFF